MTLLTINEDENHIFCKFSSSLTNLDKAMEHMERFIAANKKLEDIRFQLMFSIREALNNAVIHGNRNNKNLTVDCTLVYENNLLTLTIVDQGNGFNWRNKLSEKPVSLNVSSGRGLQAIANYGFQISYNDSGNTLYLSKEIM